MRTPLSITVGSAVFLLSLTGCGQSEEEQFLEGMGCEEGQSAEECGEATADEMMEDAPSAGIEDTDIWVGEGEMPAQYEGISDDPLLQDRQFTGRMGGPVDAELGEPVQIDHGPFTSYGDYVGTLTLDRLEKIESCEMYSDDATAADGRQLAQAWFTVDASDSEETFEFSQTDFEAQDDDAVNSESSSLAGGDTWSCQDHLELPDPVEAGASGERVLIFELPEPDSIIIYIGGVFDVTWGKEDNDSSEAQAGDALPSAGEIDFYGPINHPSDLQADISTLEDCETAEIIWGGLINGELEGFDIDQEYLADLESWMQANGCW